MNRESIRVGPSSRRSLTRLLAGAHLLGLGACGASLAGPPRPELEALELDVPARLDAGALAGPERRFEVRDGGGLVVPHALLMFEWEDFGALGFQTDPHGGLGIRLEADLAAQPVGIRVLVRPEGQDLLAQTFDEGTRELPGARLRIEVRR